MRRLLPMLMLVHILLSYCAGQADAGDNGLAIPDRVDARHRACQEIMRLADKYGADPVFSKEFEEQGASCTRLDVAVALDKVTEKMAQKVASEGPGAVDRSDLELIDLLRSELRGEMILVNTRTFRLRHEELGTRLHALTKNITISGGMVGVLQGSFNNQPRNHVEVVGRADLVFNFRIAENTIAVIDLEATGGNGIDSQIPNFSSLNGIAGSTDDRVRFREAWIEHSAFNNRLLVRAGKIDMYFDENNIANDENSQFLANAFVNSAILGAPLTGPGIRLQLRLTDTVLLLAGYGSENGKTSDVVDHGFGFGELDFRIKPAGREGNYRFYCTIDGSQPGEESTKVNTATAFGFGTSIDQQISDRLTIFGRYGWHEEVAYQTSAAWSAGLQYLGVVPGRGEDVLGLAYGQVLAKGVTAQEKLAEMYYKLQINPQIDISGHLQYLISAGGDRHKEDVLVAGLRTQVVF